MKTFSKKSDVAGDWQKAVKKPIPVNCVQIHEAFQVKTLEGMMQGKPGDWLMEGIQGELYACDDSIFKKTYDLK
ncbi:PGDYG domain-containing protein [Leeuwenhoekiella nanhaiensis]|uniref:Uncharacterized protein n=1 Tax=Leeuwenhoekiella nanhaiensis TaxID=1655491 RepID=A0A2G1VTY3_9FLAO|nr:PGDYG domain-containing protein [Leeuwenhoekiella nanhaiensis]PHQ30247.1 hypothetical protein CJ305_04600 [Leeuwenhoekiella nanhaiensis]